MWTGIVGEEPSCILIVMHRQVCLCQTGPEFSAAPSQTSLPSLIIALCVSDLSASPLKPFNHLKKSQDKNWTHVRIVTVGKKQTKKPPIHITFSKNSKEMKVCLSTCFPQSIWSWFTSRLYFLLAPRCVSCGPSVNTEWRQQMYNNHMRWLKNSTVKRVICRLFKIRLEVGQLSNGSFIFNF